MEKLFADKSMRSIMKALGCDSTDAQQALLACLKFQHLNDEVPERQSVMIKDGKLRLFVKEQSCCTWMEAVTEDLWDLLGNFERHAAGLFEGFWQITINLGRNDALFIRNLQVFRAASSQVLIMLCLLLVIQS